ncbi:MAG: DUF3471 domain-containing protein, partial [bacterium]
TNGKLNNGKEIDYALALVNGTYKGLKTVQHGGALGGYRAQLLRFPEQQFSVIILSNLASFSPGQMAYKVADVYLADQLRENQTETAENPDVTDRKTISIDPAILAKYTGKYELQPGFVITITRENDQLMAQATGQAKFSIFPESETKFYYKIVNAQITFQADQREKVTQIILHQGGRDMPATKEIQLAEYTGEYYSSELQVTYNVFMQTDSLFVRVGSSPKTLLEMYQKDIFAGPGIKGMIIRNENGKITGFTLDAGRVKNLKLEKKE